MSATGTRLETRVNTLPGDAALTNLSTPYPSNSTIPELFADQALATPDEIALTFGTQNLSYAELDARANRLANYLQRHGVGPGTMVGICQERSVDLIISLLAILKAGGAYVPLDANYPAERQRWMLEEARVPLLLHDGAQRERLSGMRSNARLISVDDLAHCLAPEDSSPPRAGVTASDPAYVMYTSGSTGTPKGVVVPHRAVVRLVRNTNYFDAAGEVFLQLAPVSFDASTFEIWGALLNGSRLAIMRPGTAAISELADAIREYGVTTLWLTAGLFHLVVDERLDALRPLHQLLAGGDVLSPAHVARVLEALPPGARLINGYGPTENTTFTCCHVMRSGDATGNSVPIGRPISNTQVYLLDERLVPVPGGEVGEIFIGGDGLALGYMNDPLLTAQKFIANPFSNDSEERLYRTGDLGRSGKDGVIEFLGRIDNQVKINGHRIEPSEIESVLGQHPLVRSAAVVCRTGARAQKQLVAFVTAHSAGLTSAALRGYLKTRVPDYLTPSAITILETLPLSPNGKVDRTALAALASEGADARVSMPSRSMVHQKISEIWKKVLGTEPRGPDENFFDSGGDSLQLIEVHSALELALNIRISITELFEYTTINSLASHLSGGGVGSFSLISVQERARKQSCALATHRDHAKPI